MADLARILALPSPRSFGAGAKPAGNLLHPVNDVRADAANGKSLSVGQADAAEGSAAQAKRFRFRAYDGAARSTQSIDLQRDQARAAANRASVAAETGPTTAGTDTAGQAEPKAIATFLAQLISQEQLGQGLYVPPVKTADIAYRRAGGEPSIDIGSPARFSLAV